MLASNDSKKQSTSSIPTWFQPLFNAWSIVPLCSCLFFQTPSLHRCAIYIDDRQQVCFRMFSVTFLICSLGICHSLASLPGSLPGFLLWHPPHQQHVTICIATALSAALQIHARVWTIIPLHFQVRCTCDMAMLDFTMLFRNAKLGGTEGSSWLAKPLDWWKIHWICSHQVSGLPRQSTLFPYWLHVLHPRKDIIVSEEEQDWPYPTPSYIQPVEGWIGDASI